MANAYPGLYDGLIVGLHLPGRPGQRPARLPGAAALLQQPGARGRPASSGPSSDMAAAAGPAEHLGLRRVGRVVLQPACSTPTPPAWRATSPSSEPESVYNAETNPAGVRCTLQDYLVNVLGTRPPDRWGDGREADRPRASPTGRTTTSACSTGCARCWRGDITPAQFVDLNAKVGAVDIDYETQPTRVEADPDAIVTAYRCGVAQRGQPPRPRADHRHARSPATATSSTTTTRAGRCAQRLDRGQRPRRQPRDLVRPRRAGQVSPADSRRPARVHRDGRAG